jgi:hypothetical protein
MLRRSPCTLKLDEERSKHAGLASSIFAQFAEFAQQLPAREECNKYDVTAGSLFLID